MFCMICQNELVDCVCPDIEERLNSLRGCPNLHIPTIVDKPLVQRVIKKEQKKNRPDENPSKN